MVTPTHIKLSWRIFAKDIQTSVLNVAGLASGMACAILIWLWVNDELSVDKFHENDARIYQVIKNSKNDDGTIDVNQATPGVMADLLKREMPEVEYSAPLISHPNGILKFNNQPYKGTTAFTTADFFRIFTYHFVSAIPQNLLSSPNEILISDQMAQKVFGTLNNVVGQTIEWQDEEWQLTGPYKISGIFKATPLNSTHQFDVFFSYQHYYNNLRERYGLDKWYSNSAQTFLLLTKGTSVSSFNNRIKDYGRKKMMEMHGPDYVRYEGDVSAQKYSSQYLYNRYENGKLAGGRIEYVHLFSLIGICILVLACMNFMNLATARASSRIKEVGIRKMLGAQKHSLIAQYFSESVFMAFISLAIALVLVQLVLPQFEMLTGKQVARIITVKTVAVVFAITIFTGLLAGSYPALFFSAYKPENIFSSVKTMFPSQANFRRALVTLQFTFSILFIISVLVIGRQMKLIQQKNLGFNKNNVIRIETAGQMKRDASALLAHLRKVPGVVTASAMNGDLVGNNGGGGGISWPGQTAGHAIEFDALNVSEGWTETLGIQLTAGRPFSAEHITNRNVVIFNETAIKEMGLEDPIGKRVNLWGSEATIIGIVKDFNYEALYRKPRPLLLTMADETANILVRLPSGKEKQTIDNLREAYTDFTKGLPFDFKFLDDDFARLYAAEERIATLSAYFTVLVIIICCLGLFGLVAFTVKKREKEIAIRKIAGARVEQISVLLSRDYLKLIMLAICIALPLSTIIINNWLAGFAYRVQVTADIYLIGSGTILILALITGSYYSIRAALTNPATTLRKE